MNLQIVPAIMDSVSMTPHYISTEVHVQLAAGPPTASGRLEEGLIRHYLGRLMWKIFGLFFNAFSERTLKNSNVDLHGLHGSFCPLTFP